MNYTVAPTDATVAITCDQETGFTREGNDVTFTAAATYVFTVTATNDAGEASGTITVTVKDGSSPSTPDAPQITINEPTAEVNLEGGEAEYTLDYSVTPADAAVSITCNRTTGFTREGNDVTFTAAATYTFTIVATSEGGTAKGTIRVTVNEEVLAPAFTKDQADVSLELTTAQFPSTSAVTLDYTVTGGGEMAMSLAETTDPAVGGWTYDADAGTITFTKAGTYTFTLTATNEKGSDTSTFTATVTDRFAGVNRQEAFLNADFTSTQIPSGWTELKGTNGSITYSENGAKFDVASTSDNNAIVRTPFTVNEGLVEISVTFSNDYSREGGQGDVPFLNLIVLESADTNTVSTWPVGVGVQDSYLVVHEGTDKGSGGWNSGSMSIGSSQRVRLIDGEKYTVKAIIDFDNERYYLYISGANRYDDDRTTVIPLGEDVYLGNFDFRGNGNDPAMFRFGTNAVDTQATLYSVTACRLGAVAPEIRVENTTANVQLSGGTASYKLNYSVTPADAAVTVTCDNQSADIGADKKTVTFDTAGTYVFTIKAVNDEITRTATITVTVVAEDVVPPVITVNTAEKDDLYLTGDSVEYALDYTVTPDTAAVTVTCDQQSGAVIDSDNKTVTFTAAGVYTFTITAVNDNVTETETIVVTVTEKPAFTAEQDDTSAILQSAQYPNYCTITLDYAISGSAYTLEVAETTSIGGWTYNADANTITFTKAGAFEFSITAKNAAGNAVCTFNVTVTDLYANLEGTELWNTTFNGDTIPEGWTENKADGATITYSAEGATFSAGAGDNTAFVKREFTQNSGLAEITVTFSNDYTAVDNEKPYINIIFLESSSTNIKTYPVCIGSQDSYLLVNDGSAQTFINIGNDTRVRLVDKEQYTIRAVIDFDNERIYLYISGEIRNTDDREPIALGENIYLGNFDFRGNGNDPVMFRFGTNAQNTVTTLYSTTARTITSGTVEIAPTFSKVQDDASLTLQTQQYDHSSESARFKSRPHITLSYEVTASPAATVTLEETTEIGGWYYDEATKNLYFTKGGYYEFKLTASNDVGTDAEETFAVTVTDLYAEGNYDENEIWNQQFNSTEKPENWTEEATTGNGSVTWSEDGLKIAGGNGNNAFVRSDFGVELKGLVEFTVDFTLNQTGEDFANIFFILDYEKDPNNSNGSSVITVAVEKGKLEVNQGNNQGGWKSPALYGNASTNLIAGVRYTIRAVLDTETERMYLYLSGEKCYEDDRATEFNLNGEVYLGNFDFRDSGSELLTYRTGSNNGTSDFTLHSIVAKQLTEKGEEPQPEAPTVTVNEENGEVTLSGGTASYTLNYSVDPADATVSIACNQENGFEITENKTVKFNAAGTYVFTITASKDGSTSTPQTITVVVNAEAVLQAPTFTTPQEDDSLTLQTAIWTSAGATTERPHIQLAYEVSDPEANVTLEETTSIGGWTYDAEAGVIYFTRGGSYEFKLTASNSEGSADCTFAVDVTDLYAESGTASAPVIFDQQFNAETKPDGWTETIGTPGTDSITYSGNGVTLHKDTSGKSAFLQYDFDEQMTGVIEFTVDFKTTSTGFVNLFFLRGNGNKYAVTVAVQNNILMVNENDKSWSNNINLFNNTKTRLVPGVDYTLRAVVDCDNERVYLYISGESLIADGEGDTVGETVAMGDNLYLGNFDFRVNGQPVLAYRMGSDIQKAESDFTVYSITAKQLSPVITVNQSSAAVDFVNNTATYTLNYTVSEFGSPEAAVITCDQETGWTNEGNVITFTQTGTYVFTVTAENAYGSGSGTITVTVKKPTTGVTIDVDSDRDAAVNAGGYYTLKYTAGSDVANVELTCDQQDGYSYDAETGLIHFTAPGVYNFTLTATDEGETLTDTSNFKVTVTDEENVIWNPTLTSEVSGPDITNTADGAENRGTITFDQNGMTVTSGAGIGGSAPLIFYKKFDSALSGLVKTEITFVDNLGTGFINLVFFQNSGIVTNQGNEATMVIAVENGALRHRGMVDGSLEGWTSFSMDGQLIKVQPGEEYTLTIYNDFDNEISYIYLTGTVVLGESTKELDNCYLGVSNFRRQGKGDAVEYFYTGTSQRNTSYTIKSLNIEQSFAPQIFMNSSYNVQEGGTLALNTLGAADGYIIDCAQEGWSIEGNVITFAQSGTYEMTVRAYSDQGESDAVSITANVAKYGAWLEENGEVVINTIAAMEQSDYANYGNGSVEEEVWTPWTNCTVTGMHNADNGTSWNTPEDAKANAPWLEFKVKIQTPGTYTMFVQLSSLSTVNNSIHCGHDGTPFQCSNPGSFYIGKWIYTNQYTFELTEGEHTISLYVREDGSAPNQIWLRNMGDDTTSTFDYRSGWVDGASKIESAREIIAE